MKNDLALRIQSYLDNELAPAEALEMARLLEQDVEARTLHGELVAIRDLTVANEPEFRLPESGDFFWSKIKREISPVGARPLRESPLASFWASLWPKMGAASMVLLGIGLVISLNRQGSVGSQTREIESALEEMSTITFHSDAANMTVVWVQNAELK